MPLAALLHEQRGQTTTSGLCLALRDLLLGPRVPEPTIRRAVEEVEPHRAGLVVAQDVAEHAPVEALRLPFVVRRRGLAALCAPKPEPGRDVLAHVDGVEQAHGRP